MNPIESVAGASIPINILIGTGIGIGGATIIGVFTSLKPSIPLAVIAIATSVSGSIGVIFGIVPARRAAQLDLIVALRSA